MVSRTFLNVGGMVLVRTRSKGLLVIRRGYSKLETLKLSKQESYIAMGMAHQAKEIMLPVPFFILFPFSLHRQNEELMIFVIRGMIADANFVKKSGVEKDRLEMILLGVAGFEVWKRGWVMRIQWIFQVLALIMLGQILWSIF
jgi:hypothetical protein